MRRWPKLCSLISLHVLVCTSWLGLRRWWSTLRIRLPSCTHSPPCVRHKQPLHPQRHPQGTHRLPLPLPITRRMAATPAPLGPSHSKQQHTWQVQQAIPRTTSHLSCHLSCNRMRNRARASSWTEQGRWELRWGAQRVQQSGKEGSCRPLTHNSTAALQEHRLQQQQHQKQQGEEGEEGCWCCPL